MVPVPPRVPPATVIAPVPVNRPLTSNFPALTEEVPEYVLVAFNVNTPAPALIKLPPPEMTPFNEMSWARLETSAALKVKLVPLNCMGNALDQSAFAPSAPLNRDIVAA